MKNSIAEELLALARHYEEFNMNSQDIDLLKRAANELEDLQVLQDKADEIEWELFNY